jgi:hypothetical protein
VGGGGGRGGGSSFSEKASRGMIWTFWQGSEIENCASGPGFWILLRIVKKSPNFLKGIDTKFLY